MGRWWKTQLNNAGTIFNKGDVVGGRKIASSLKLFITRVGCFCFDIFIKAHCVLFDNIKKRLGRIHVFSPHRKKPIRKLESVIFPFEENNQTTTLWEYIINLRMTRETLK